MITTEKEFKAALEESLQNFESFQHITKEEFNKLSTIIWKLLGWETIITKQENLTARIDSIQKVIKKLEKNI